MRILLTSSQAPFLRGGAEMHADNLEAALQRAGHAVEHQLEQKRRHGRAFGIVQPVAAARGLRRARRGQQAAGAEALGQQFYVIRRMPAPGSPAEKALAERRRRRGKEHKSFSIPGLHRDEDAVEEADSGTATSSGSSAGSRPSGSRPRNAQPPSRPSGQRQQPKRRKNKR